MLFDGSIPVRTADAYLAVLEEAAGRDGVVQAPLSAEAEEIYLDAIHLNASGHARAAQALFRAIAESDEFALPSGANRGS